MHQIAREQRTRWAPVAAMGLAMLVVTVELTLTAVTLPLIGADLGAGPAATTWVVLAYALPTAALAIPAGRWADGADLRRVLLLAVTAVGLTSVLAAAAPTFELLVAARVLQGVAGALVAAVYMPLIRTVVAPSARGRALGYVTTIMPAGTMAGASLGGLVAGAFGWRPVFLIKLPLLVAVLWLTHRTVPPAPGGLPMPGWTPVREALLLGGGVTAVLLALDRVQAAPVTAAVCLAVAVPPAVLWARLPDARPLLAFARGRRSGPLLLALLLACTIQGLTAFLLPYAVGSPELLGLALLFHIGTLAAVSPLAGALADSRGPQTIARLGIAVTLAGLLTLLTLPADPGLLDLAWRLVIIGGGQALFNAPHNAALLAAAPPGQTGAAGGASITVRTLGMTLGPAATALAWTAHGDLRAGVLLLAVLQLAALAAQSTARTRP
ncbi:MFS transporter [Thermomonospora cellulosilytica]|uniref:Putative MFS family arabinose efflux permease n=1 Tax=Thermomonospora cellulosilytica TaxID=1411118 RepID=A0A7W3MYK8_9ACTN|nr:MFS transporter [Thermomonospora cellulosilytica]MBA9004280.1 putative MFS family arabinose efflux permease [Thermomonospora cellulosilytica]